MEEIKKDIANKKEILKEKKTEKINELKEKKEELVSKVEVSLNKKPGELKAPERILILFTIVNRNKANFYKDVLEGFDVNLQLILYARGTANKQMLDILGVNDDSKAVLISAVCESRIKDVLIAYEDKYFKTRDGHGVAFTVSLDSMIGVMAYKLLADVREDK